MIDWSKIKTEYITTNISYRGLCKKYGVSLNALSKHAREENWLVLRERKRDAVATKAVEKEIDRQVERYARLLTVTDKLLAKIEAAVDSMDEENFVMDKSGIRALTAAIKDIKEVQSLKGGLDIQEQKARIAKLEREAKGDDEQDKTIILKISDDLNDYAN